MVTYDAKITVLDVSKKLARIEVTRTDDSTTPATVQTVTIQNAILDTGAQKLAVENKIKEEFTAIETLNAQVVAVVSDLESTLVDHLTSWESTR